MKILPCGVAVAESDSHLSAWVEQQGTLAVAEGYCRLFAQYIPVGGVVLDIGACIGDHTITYSEMVGPLGRVYAFEPNPVAFECLSHNMLKCVNVLPLRIALGDRAGFGHTIQDANLGASQFSASGPAATTGSTAMVTIDTFMGLKRLDFIKIDAEGWEPEILRGGEQTIRRLRPAMLIEVNRPVLAKQGKTDRDIFDQLTALGYGWQPAEPHLSMELEMIDILALPLK